MARLPRYGPPDGDADRRSYGAIATQAFAGVPAAFETWLRGFGEDVRVLRETGVLGGLVFYRMGQFFGGNSVPTWGVAGVALRPELRGRGLGHELMLNHLREQFDNGPAISTLYPAAPALYRNLGWELAGSRTCYVARLADLPQDRSELVIRPATVADEGLIAATYAQQAAQANGCLNRSDAIWGRVRRTPDESPLCSYIAERDGRAQGHALYVHKRDASGTVKFDLHVRDLVCLTPDAASAFMAYFASHRSVANQIYFYGAPHDPILLHTLRGPEVRIHDRQDWMLRIVRVSDALQGRGYSPHVSAAANVTVRDEALPANDGHWKLALHDGSMQATKGGKGGPTLRICGLAALYSSAMTPAQLRTASLLQGSEKHDSALAAMFAGPAPWMPDYF